MNNKIKLFETVMGIAGKGAVSLTASERSTIENETKELLAMANRKKAAMAPEGFEDLLMQLKMVDNADEAFAKVVDYLKTHKEVEEAIDPLVEPEEHMDGLDLELGKKPMGLELDKGPMGMDKGPMGKSPMGMDADPIGKIMEVDKGPMGMDKEMDKPGIPESPKHEEKESIGEKKEEKEDGKPEFGKGKPDFLKDKKEEPKMDSKAIAASNVKVRITANKTLLVSYAGKPVFHAVPSAEVQSDMNKLRATANQVYTWCVTEGMEKAASKCRASKFAGVDEDVVVNHSETVKEEKDPSTADAEFVTEEKPEDAEGAVTEDAEFVTKETPEKVTAGVDDDAEFNTEETPESMPSSVEDGQDDVIEDSLESPENDVRDRADVNFEAKISCVEEDYRKLYAAKSKKLAKEAQNAFVDKFIRALKVASTRMLLNYDEHPMKAAALDVLVDDSFRFANGDSFMGLHASDAQEIVERIASVGHQEFVEKLLDKTASLMKKSDEYLSDLESDLGQVTVKPVAAAVAKPSRTASKSVSSKEANEGNFAINRVPATHSATVGNSTGVREAIGSSLLKRANALKQLVG